MASSVLGLLGEKGLNEFHKAELAAWPVSDGDDEGDAWVTSCSTVGCKAMAGLFRPDGRGMTLKHVEDRLRANGWSVVDGETYCPSCSLKMSAG